MTNKQPRGIRNNNPLNIRKSPEQWQGKIQGSDTEFETFSSMLYGIRAAFVCIRTYLKRFAMQGVSPTVENIISRWAPSSENDTVSYIRLITYRSRFLLHHDSIVRFEDKDTMVLLLWCMAYVECGVNLSFVDFSEAYEMV